MLGNDFISEGLYIDEHGRELLQYYIVLIFCSFISWILLRSFMFSLKLKKTSSELEEKCHLLFRTPPFLRIVSFNGEP